MAIELPPWLTRQYDYASGIRQTGQQIAENLQRRKALETYAIRAAAQAEQARALESWRLAQAQSLQEKTRMEQEREAKDAEALGKITEGLNELPQDAPIEHKLGKVLEFGSGLHPERFKALVGFLDKQRTLEGRKEIVEATEEGKNKRLDKTLQNKLELNAIKFGIEPKEGEDPWEIKDIPNTDSIGVRMKGSKLWKTLKKDELSDLDKITLQNYNQTIRQLEMALTKVPTNADNTVSPERADIEKQLRRYREEKATFLERRGTETKDSSHTKDRTSSTKRIRVIGPPGPDGKPQVGTVPEGTKLTEGWSVIE